MEVNIYQCECGYECPEHKLVTKVLRMRYDLFGQFFDGAFKLECPSCRVLVTAKWDKFDIPLEHIAEQMAVNTKKLEEEKKIVENEIRKTLDAISDLKEASKQSLSNWEKLKNQVKRFIRDN